MPPSDLNYEQLGVAPPSHDPHITEERIEEYFSKPVKHGKWLQKGVYIECHACPYVHGHRVPTDMLLQGTDENGEPILKKLD